MNDEQADHAELHLYHLVVVRVVHESAVLLERVFVFESLARLNRLLRYAGYAVHATWDQDAVPVNARWRRETVRDVDAHMVAFDGLDGRTVDALVVAPTLSDE